MEDSMFNWYQLELFKNLNWNIWGVYKGFLGPFLVDGRKQKIKDDKKYRLSLYTAPCTGGAYKDGPENIFFAKVDGP